MRRKVVGIKSEVGCYAGFMRDGKVEKFASSLGNSSMSKVQRNFIILVVRLIPFHLLCLFAYYPRLRSWQGKWGQRQFLFYLFLRAVSSLFNFHVHAK